MTAEELIGRVIARGLPTLSIRQPWPDRIFYEGKDVENREWSTKGRGAFLIHAGKKVDGDADDQRFYEGEGLKFGGIVGVARITDCVTTMDSRWFCGKYGFVLADAHPLEFLPCKGALSFFRPDIDPADLRPLASLPGDE